ncbi:type II toxin-antitoxin system RatA family toxin [Rickettsiales endosymbiont of Stachyamoeba lipophora]|uniref:type II toxin-antitoxin system RatA family toxin n=1 Tax=Rickettsiales endosymbiont of Stachyamoeba lipophora TaxID=2486578 RepID=UPI000F64AD9C|nr:type II toxin-antitoxin system RatA family toxin [Rickettsiales endosymbiont of Stachyamoeba lipophora]AZL14966.1 type II toxin-antitoxin system RatA family toxin [Rickettsiales endosymbiont of Stachyamoeba lipophora]
MIQRKLTKFLPFSPLQLYELVLDINSYPKFIPWCAASRVLETHEDYLIADLVIKFSGLSEKYTSKVIKFPYENTQHFAEIKVELISGPFKHLYNYWKFNGQENGTEIEFEIAFSFNSSILEKLMSLMFEKALVKMIDAFEEQANKIYK